MDAVFNALLRAKDEDVVALTEIMVKHQDQVIESFGGITNMIEMCLTNPNAHQFIDVNSQQFISFKKVLQTNNAHPDNHDICKNADNISTIEIHYGNNNDDVNPNNTNANTNISHNNDQQCSADLRSPQAPPTTVAEFHGSTLRINCDSKHNMLFTLIENNNIATFIFNTILSKRFVFFGLFLGIIFSIVSVLRLHAPSTETILLFNITRIAICISTILFGSCVILIANKTMIYLVTNTFDFWFKIYNMILLYGSGWIRLYGIANDNDDDAPDDNTYVFVILIFYHFGTALVLICAFLMDALPVNIKLKRAALITVSVFGIIDAHYTYFYAQDYQWNPFNSRYSQISFKSIVLSSWVNVIIFLTKPLWSDTTRYIRKTLCSKDGTYASSTIATDHDKGKKYQKCHTVYKRPYVEWHKY